MIAQGYDIESHERASDDHSSGRETDSVDAYGSKSAAAVSRERGTLSKAVSTALGPCSAEKKKY